MQTNPYATEVIYMEVDGQQIATDQEGYIQNMEDWSESFVNALAKKEELELTPDHWDVIRFIRKYYEGV